MELSGIENFLEAYRKRLFKAEDARQAIIQLIKKVSGVELAEKEIEIKKGTIVLHANTVIKNQIFLYKEKILDEFKKSGVADIYDIY